MPDRTRKAPFDDVTVRQAGAEDMGAVAGLRWRWVRDQHGEPDVPQEAFAEQFAVWADQNSATHECFVLRRAGQVIGMAWLAVTPRVPFPRSLERRTGDVQCVYVVPHERDGGLGGRLIDAVLRRARDLGLERVVVHSSSRAIPAYQRHGFDTSPKLLQVNVRTLDYAPAGE